MDTIEIEIPPKRLRGKRGSGNGYALRIASGGKLHKLKPHEWRDYLEAHLIERVGEKTARVAAGVDVLIVADVLTLKRRDVVSGARTGSITGAVCERLWLEDTSRVKAPGHLFNDVFGLREFYQRWRAAAIDLDCAMRGSLGGNELHFVSEAQRAEVVTAMGAA